MSCDSCVALYSSAATIDYFISRVVVDYSVD